MRWLLEVAFIGITSSWKWSLGSVAVVSALVGLLFLFGVLGGGDGGDLTSSPVTASPTPTPSAAGVSTPVPTPASTPVPDAPAPTQTPAPASKVISVPILATRANNVGSLEFVLVYDPAKLEFSRLERGLLTGDSLIDFSSPGPGRIWAGIVDVQGINGSGTVAVVKFNLRDGADGAVALTLENIAAFDANTLVDIITVSTPGQFSGSGLATLSPILTFQ